MRALLGCCLLAQTLAAGPVVNRDVAFGGPGERFAWATSEKQGVGTAYEVYDSHGRYGLGSPTAPLSRVWFTVARGIVTEVFYPRVDMAQTRDMQFIVTGANRLFQEEQQALEHQVTREPGSTAYRIRSRDPGNRYVITKEIWADPDSDTVIQNVRIERYVEGLKFHLLHKPAAANSLFGDTAQAEPFLAGENRGIFSAWQGVAATIPFRRTSVGYVGKSDGFHDLFQDGKLDWSFKTAPDGNVSFIAELDIPPTAGTTEFTVFLFFAPTKDLAAARHATIRSLDVAESRRRFKAQWAQYLRACDLPLLDSDLPERRNLAEASLLFLKSAEDKTFAGSVVASLSHPWGETAFEHEAQDPARNSSYHAVWPRDVYHVAGGFLAAGDRATAVAIARRLVTAQYGELSGEWHFGPRRRAKHGSFPQNFWADGKPVHGGYQADETAMPILLAYRLWKENALGPRALWGMVRDAAQFLADFGPWTQTERWEEAYGLSPNSAGYVIAAMVAASELAAANGEAATSAKWLALADSWSGADGNNLDTWTFTTKGRIGAPFGDGRYYLRLSGSKVDPVSGGSLWDAPWDPNEDGIVQLANFFGEERFRRETEIVDSSFLALVRVGVRAATHPLIRASLPETDAMLRRDTPRGPGWYRYRYDGYGEQRRGRLWPLLTGERLHYELQWLKETGELSNSAALLESRTRGFEAFASATGVLAEQVWDEGPQAGQPTGSAAPLSWSHAEYLQWLRSWRQESPLEEIASVRARYSR